MERNISTSSKERSYPEKLVLTQCFFNSYLLFPGKLAVLFSLFMLGAFFQQSLFAQNIPCNCTQRWTDGGTWNMDGSVNDAPNAPPPNGVIKCASQAGTQPQVAPINSCIYDPLAFPVDISGFTCIDPSTGEATTPAPSNPVPGQPIIWLNFDVRPNAGVFDIQLNDNAADDNLAFALFYSNSPTQSTSTNAPNTTGNQLSGDCSDLTLYACGVESSNTFNTITVPEFTLATNFYLAVWDTKTPADGDVSINNFKARFGCGNGDFLACNIDSGDPVITCNADGTYTVEVPVMGVNGEFIGYDPNANNLDGLSDPICLTNSEANPAVTSGVISLTYNQGVDYDILILETNNSTPPPNVSPGVDCDHPTPYPQGEDGNNGNADECVLSLSGTAPVCCVCVDPPTIMCPPDQDLGCNPDDLNNDGIPDNIPAPDPSLVTSGSPNAGCNTEVIFVSDSAPVMSGTCDYTITRTYRASNDCGDPILFTECTQLFTWKEAAPVIANCPTNMTASSCATQQQVDDFFAIFLGQFTASGGCNAVGNFVENYSAPSRCGGSIEVFYMATDDCGQDDICSAIFTVTSPPTLSVTCPQSENLGACMTQTDVDAAFATFLQGFSTSGGCNGVGTFAENYTAPDVCVGGTVTVVYSATDDCNQSDNCTRTFTVAAPPTLSVICPQNEDLSACMTQANVDAVFATFLQGFSISGGCNGAGMFAETYTAPDVCVGGTVTVVYSATDDCNQSDNCTRTFTVAAPPTLSVTCPQSENLGACMTQTDVDAAFATFLQGFSTSGGCNGVGTFAENYTAPDVCVGGTVTVVYSATDDCNQSDNCTRTFTVAAPPTLSVICPQNEDLGACMTQASVDAAFTTFLQGFSTSGGCNAMGMFAENYTAPDVCVGGTVTVVYSATDDCNQSDNCTRTFTVAAPPTLSVTCPQNEDLAACMTQADVDAAFATFLQGFSTSGGCNGAGMFAENYTAPDVCVGGTVTVVYSATDDCNQSDNCTRTFTVAAPPTLSVICPQNEDLSACMTQADVDAAFTTFLQGFSTNGGCNGVGTFAENYSAPDVCVGGTVTVVYSATDDCNQSDNCTRTFTVAAPPTLSVTCPQNEDLAACMTQADVDAAFATFLQGFSTNGGCNGMGMFAENYTAPDVCVGGTVTVVYSATDDCNQSDNCTKTFTVAAPPTLSVTCPQNENLGACMTQADVDAAFATFLQGFSTSGGCNDMGTFAENYTAPDVCVGGTVTVVYSATDDCNQSDNCTRTFTVAAPPTLSVTCPQSENLGACMTQADVDAAFATFLQGFSTSGGCNGAGMFAENYTAPDVCVGGTVTVVYSATDDCNQSDNCTRTFTVAAPPTLSVTCPQNEDLAACMTQADIDAAFTTFLQGFSTSGGCNGAGMFAENYTAPDVCVGGTVTVVYSATDDCNQSDNCTKTFTVAAPPTLSVTCPQNENLGACMTQVDVDAAFATFLQGFSTSGGCNGVGMFAENYTAPDVCVGGTVTVVYSATDDCNQSDNCTRTFTVAAPPTLSVSCPQNENLGACMTQADVDAAFTTFLLGFSTSGGCNGMGMFAENYTAPDVCVGGTVTVVYSATDDCNQSDNCARTFTVAAPPTLSVSCPQNENFGACLTQDAVNANFTTFLLGFSTSGGCNGAGMFAENYTAPDVCVGGTVTVVYTATDDCNQSDNCTRTFTVAAPPTLSVSCPQNENLGACMTQADVDAAFTTFLQGFSTSGGCNGVGTFAENYTAPDVCVGGTVTVVYSATDDCNQSDNCTRTFTVAAPPTLSVSCPQNENLGACLSQDAVNAAFATFLQGFSTNGGCNAVGTFAGNYTAPDVCVGGTVTVVYTATDDCNQTDNCTRTFTVAAPPILSVSCPQNENLGACMSQDAVNAAFATFLQGFSTNGGCNAVGTFADNYTAPDVCVGGTVTVVYTATDDCNQTDNCTRTFTVAAPPVLSVSCPQNENLGACMSQDAVNAAFATFLQGFSTNGGCNAVGTFAGNYTAPDVCVGGTVTVVYTATDDCNQTDNCTRTFTVAAPPMLSVSCPQSENLDACMSQADVNAAFTVFLQGFSTSGGCNGVGVFAEIYTAPNACTGGTVAVVYSATDDCGQTASCTAQFSVAAPSAVVVTCPGNEVVACMDDIAADIAGVTVSGGCGPYEVTAGAVTPALTNTMSGNCPGDRFTIVYTATDACDQTSTCTQTFVIQNTAPMIAGCPADQVFSCDDVTTDAILQWIADAEGDILAASTASCGSALQISNDFDPDTNLPIVCDIAEGNGVGINFTITDECGRTDICSATIFVIDDTPPVITPTFGNVMDGDTFIVECNNADPDWNPFVLGPNDVDIDDCTDVEITFEDVLVEQGICGVSDFISLYRCTWTATDACGNTSTFNIFMKIVDTKPPVFSNIPPNTTINCDDPIPTDMPTALDACSSVELSVSQSTIPGNCEGYYTIIRAFTAIDACGNANTVAQTINVVDEEAPMIFPVNNLIEGLIDGQRIALNCDDLDKYVFTASDVHAIDNCSPTTTIDYQFAYTDYQDCSTTGYLFGLTATWTATDDCGNASTFTLFFQFEDQTPPVFDDALEDLCATTLPQPPSVSATDACGLAFVSMEQLGPETCQDGIGTFYTRIWTATDECGNTTEVTQQITINDNTGPMIAFDHPVLTGINDGDEVELETNCSEADFGLQSLVSEALEVDDNCGLSDVNITTELLGEGDCATDGFLYRVKVTVTLTDVCDNASALAFVAILVDNTPPVFEDVLPLYSISCGEDYPELTATDGCSGIASITVEDVNDPQAFCGDQGELYVRRWTAVDSCGNESTVLQEIRIIDDIGPDLIGVPADTCDVVPPVAVVTAIDACLNVPVMVTFSEQTIAGPCGDIIERTWSAEDECGNVSSATQRIYFNDNEAPVLSFNAPVLADLSDGDEVTLSCGEYLLPNGDLPDFGTDAVLADDACSSGVDLQLERSLLDEGDCATDGYLSRYRYRWVATDACGNMSTLSLIVVFIDDYAPVIYNMPANLTLYCIDELPTVVAPLVADDCSAYELSLQETTHLVEGGRQIRRTWTATDACGNASSATQFITIYDTEITCSFALQGIIACGSDDNQLTVIAGDGQAPYTYVWEMVDCDGFITGGQGTETITFTAGYTPLNFVVTITDANGCETICTYHRDCIKVDNPNEDDDAAGRDIGIFPNPASDEIRVDFPPTLDDTEMIVYLRNSQGQRVRTFLRDREGASMMKLDVSDMPAGVYYLQITADSRPIHARSVLIMRK